MNAIQIPIKWLPITTILGLLSLLLGGCASPTNTNTYSLPEKLVYSVPPGVDQPAILLGSKHERESYFFRNIIVGCHSFHKLWTGR